MAPNKRLLLNSAAVMSTGLVVVAKPGRMALSSSWVLASSGSSGMLTRLAASAVNTHTAPELLIATSRRPAGRQPFR